MNAKSMNKPIADLRAEIIDELEADLGRKGRLEYDIPAIADKLLALITAQQNELLDKVMVLIPEKYDNYTGTDMEDYQKGHNAATAELRAEVEKLRRKDAKA